MHRMRVVIALLPLCLAACSGDGQTPPAKTDPPATIANPTTEAALTTVTLSKDAVERLAIQSVAASNERVAGTRTLGGEVVVPEGRLVTVSSPISGTLLAAGNLRAGTRVSSGDAIFRLVPLVPAERDQRIEAERAIAAAEAEDEAARQRLQRLEQLLKDGAASQRSVEEARAQRQIAAAAVTAARDRLKLVTRNPIGPQGEITITAPFSGVLQAITAAAGQTVAPSAPLFQIAQVDALWIRVPVYAGDATAIDTTQSVTVTTLDSTGAPRLAKRVTAPLSADPIAASVDLYFEIAREGPPLRPGERVIVQVPLAATENGLVIPDSAIVYDIHGTNWVYEDLGDGRYMRRRIEVARHVGDRAVVSRGLSAGTRVVSVGAAELFGTEFGAGK